MKKVVLAIILCFPIVVFSQNNDCQDIGMNLYFTSYWSREVPFANLMMQASPWVPCDADWQFDQPDNHLFFNKIEKDKQGYPTHLPQTISGLTKPQGVKSILAWDNGGILPIGTYQFLYSGDGDIELFGLDTITILKKEAGLIEFFLKPYKKYSNIPGQKGGGLGFIIRRSNKDNPVKNIRVLLPNTSQATYPFNPAFVEKLKPFKAIRFMNWNAAYWSDEVKWEDRRLPDYYTQFNCIDWFSIERKGVAIEHAVQLCNILDKDIWINIPYKADENYISELGKLVYNQLNPHLKIYLEYGNEVWNEGFSNVQNDAFERQHSFVKVNAPSFLNTKPFQYNYAYFADKAFKAFAPNPTSRVVRILAGQQGAWQGEVLQRSIEGMEFIGSKDGFDVGSVTDYMFQNDIINNLPQNATVSDVANSFRKNMDNSFSLIQDNMKHLSTIGKKMVTYEGGVHATFEAGHPNEAVLLAFSKDTSFYNISREWMQKVNRLSGVELQMAFVLADNQYGYWHVQDVFDNNPSNSLKYKALIDHCKTVETQEIEPNTSVLIFPNPVADELNIEFTQIENRTIKVMDIQGKVFRTIFSDELKTTLILSDLPKGMYFLSIENQSKSSNFKIIKI